MQVDESGQPHCSLDGSVGSTGVDIGEQGMGKEAKATSTSVGCGELWELGWAIWVEAVC